MSATPTPEQLRQRVGLVCLKRFLVTPVEEQAFLMNRWRADARRKADGACPMGRLDAKARLIRLDEWETFAAEQPEIPAPAAPVAA